MIEYPKAKYHRTKGVALVQGVEQETALGKDWFDLPTYTNRPKELKPEPPKPATLPRKWAIPVVEKAESD